MNPQDREEYGMDLAKKEREAMSEEYEKIKSSEGLQGILYFKVGENYEEIDNPEVLDFLVEKKVYIYRKKPVPRSFEGYLPKNHPYSSKPDLETDSKDFFKWIEPNTDTKTFPVITKEIADYLNKQLSNEYGSPDDLIRNGYEQGLFNSLPKLTNEEWKGLETYYMPNVGVMRKIIDRIMEIRKGEV